MCVRYPARWPGYPLFGQADISMGALSKCEWIEGPPQLDPGSAQRDNEVRARNASHALFSYAQCVGDDYAPEPVSQMIRDLLTDLMHLNDCTGASWTRQYQLARESYRIELDGGG